MVGHGIENIHKMAKCIEVIPGILQQYVCKSQVGINTGMMWYQLGQVFYTLNIDTQFEPTYLYKIWYRPLILTSHNLTSEIVGC